MKFKKIKKGIGVEWLIIFTALSMLFSVMICINYYYVIRSEARKLAINISNSIILDEMYRDSFSGIGSEEEFIKVINQLNILYEQYGNKFMKYVKKLSFFDNYNLIIPKENIGLCLLLNDNKFYSLDDNKLLEIKGDFKDFYKSKKNLKQNILLFDSNYKKLNYFLLPVFSKNDVERILSNTFNYNEKNSFEKFNNEERKVVNEEKTRNIIDMLLKNYNEERTRKAFSIKFEDTSDNKGKLYKVSEDLSKNNVSFFFYSYVNKSLENDINETDNLNYKVRSINSNDAISIDNKDKYYYYPNSLHLVICCNIYIPFISINFELKYPIDISIEHKGIE